MKYVLPFLAVVGLSAAPLPALHVVGNHLVDATGRTVLLRGVASQGMGMIYGNKANPGTYVAMTPTQYVDRAIQTDTSGHRWYANAIRLNFERFPSADPARLYQTENVPYAIPETLTFPAWAPATQYAEGDIRTAAGIRYRGVRKTWAADKGQAWNVGPYQVGDIVAGLAGTTGNPSSHLYRCTAANTATGVGGQHWDRGPRGTTTWHEDQDAWSYDWAYVAEYGLSGTVPIDQLPADAQGVRVDGFMMWARMSVDYTTTQAELNFADWKAKVMDPVVNQAIADGLYVVICEFDFGPAHLPLRQARMLDFWPRMARAWGTNPNVLFELWNESEDIGSYAGGNGSWALQKPAIQSVVNAIRAAGATNVILIPTPFYSSGLGEATASPIAGSDLAYSFHQYRSQWDTYGSNRDAANAGFASGQAIIMTELGDDTGNPDPTKQWVDADTPTCTDQNFSRPCPPVTLRQLPVAGWFAWALTDSWFPSLFQSRTALRTPTPYGVAVRQWLADLQTSPPPASPRGLRIIR